MTFPVMTMAQMADNGGASDPCGAAGFAGLVGQTGEIAVMLVLDQPKRVIPLGSAITRDHLRNRINFDLDAENRITRIWCG